MIRVENLEVGYGRGAKRTPAVQGLSFDVGEGECVGFIGANGAGKSTTIKALMGFLRPSGGRAEVCGLPAGDPESRRRAGYLPEVALYYPFMKAGELLRMYGTLSGMDRGALRERIPEVLEQTGLAGRGGELLRTFSKGMQQRLGIAQAILADPELLVLDEVSSGLDPLGRFDLRNLLQDLKDRGRTIFFSSHELSEVESLCDRILLIHRGRLLREVTREELAAIGRERSLESFFISVVRGREGA
ncbi:MAG: ABC transporter ATP-binding protein [Lentisphaerae bacterium]|nr:ABC transporter ATP-binding protein [Lentisphaerota bacterium]